MSHDLIYNLKAKWVEMSGQLLEEFYVQEQAGFDSWIIGDESWFFLEYSSNHMWQLMDVYILDHISREIGTEMYMFTIFWACTGRSLLNDSHLVCNSNANISVMLLLPKSWKRSGLPWEYYDKNDSSSIWIMPSPIIQKLSHNFFQ
jgi:hypothetical protein